MSNQNNSAASRGIGFFAILGLIFIVLKLTRFIDWDWYLVLMPIYGPYAALITITIVGALFVYLIDFLTTPRKKKHK